MSDGSAAAVRRLEAGAPFPLGATLTSGGVNFAVFSANAEAIDLCLFDDAAGETRLRLPEHTDEVRHGFLPGAGAGLRYGLRAHGPGDPARGHRFDPAKLLIDPYARLLDGPPAIVPAHCTIGADTGAATPKAVVTRDDFDWTGDIPPATPWDRTIVYEAHVRGLTMRCLDVPEADRGTFRALAHPAVLDHLLRIGVTALELLPVHGFVQDAALVARGLGNYWGYNSLTFFAPEARYGSADDLREAVKALHAAGIEVILDVVYNHTAEGREDGPTLSWRGLDNASYYRLRADDPRRTLDDTGTGNTLDLSGPRVIQMVADSLRWWTESFRIDGFRFDLAATLGRDAANRFDPRAGLFDVLRQDPVLSRRKLIAEPWDLGPDGYQLGNHPPGFAEWNDRFRNTTRLFWRGSDNERAEFASRIAGSADLFDRQGRRPWVSVNFVTAHDGMTLADLVSYSAKRNLANGEDNRDGADDDCASNWGVEGPSDDPAIVGLRGRVARSMLTTLMMAVGTPMLLGGDEFGRTQHGNNNAYCQDNQTSWFDWDRLRSAEGHALGDYVRRLAAIRRHYPLVRADRFLHGLEQIAPGIRDIDWFDERGDHPSEQDWRNRGAKALALRRVRRRDDGQLEAVTMLMNAGEAPILFTLPPSSFERHLVIDSADPGAAERDIDGTLLVQDRAVAVIVGTALLA